MESVFFPIIFPPFSFPIYAIRLFSLCQERYIITKTRIFFLEEASSCIYASMPIPLLKEQKGLIHKHRSGKIFYKSKFLPKVQS